MARRAPPSLLLVLIVLPIVAGCASAPTDGATVPPSSPAGDAFAGLVVQDHDHANRSLHAAAVNVELVGHVSAWGDGTFYNGSVNELAVLGPRVYVSRAGGGGGLAVINVEDPRAPFVEGEVAAENGNDVEVTSDGMVALLTTQRRLPSAAAPSRPDTSVPRGVYVIDLEDKSRPTIESFFPIPVNGPHTVAYHRTDTGRDLFFFQAYDLLVNAQSTPESAVPVTQRIYVAELVSQAGRHTLRILNEFSFLEQAPPGKLHMPHDSSVQRHPVTGQLLLYVAYWDVGLLILDVTEAVESPLTRPTVLARFTDFGPSAYSNLHYAEPFPALLGGRHVTVVAPEIITAPESGQVTFLDTTDPSNPVKLGHWTLPDGIVVDQPLLFSPHNFDLDPFGRVYLGHYHAGIWVLDASDATAPKPVGFYSPTVGNPGNEGIVPVVWGVMYQDGLFYATDGPTGLYVLRLVDDPHRRPAPGRTWADPGAEGGPAGPRGRPGAIAPDRQ